ncbi:MAG: molecular chaperone DnaJ [Chloroflexi bacterium]|nr:molecular chaperone DnaJ [Chloroflexota bacterium]
MSNGKRDYYDVLGVARNASDEEIKRAYRRLAMQYHPDRNKDGDAATKFKEVNEAYEILSDGEKRQLYDRYGHAGPRGAGYSQDFSGFAGFSDIFEDLFGGGGFSRSNAAQRRAPRRGADLRHLLTITFEEAVFGSDKEIEITRSDTCPTCQGSGAEPGTQPKRCPQCNGSGEVRRVQQTILGSMVNVSTCDRCNGEGEIVTTPCHECRGYKRVQTQQKLTVQIPAGVDDGTQIRLAGQGEPGAQGGPPGNLYVQLKVKPHKYFQRQENDILLDVKINFAQAALGDEITIPTLDGDVTLKIPAGTQTAKTFTLADKGVPYLRRSGRGDQLVSVHVVTPDNLTEQQRKLLKDLSKTLGKEVIEQPKHSIIDKVKDAFGV